MGSPAGHVPSKQRARRGASALAALATVVGTMTVVTATDVAVGSGPAFADTGPINYSCPSQLGTFQIPVDITGAIPAGLVAGDPFVLSSYQVQVTIPSSVATVLVSNGITSMSGTTGALVNATNATPSSQTPLATWGPVAVSGGGFSFSFSTVSGTVGPFTATSDAAPPSSVPGRSAPR